MKILIVEDDLVTRDYIAAQLVAAGYLTDMAANGVEGLALALEHDYEAIILDRMLPGMDGLAVLKEIRATKCDTPVLFLTAIGSVDDRVAGLEAGADDYLVKPFAFSELAARLAAIARRTRTTGDETALQVGDLEMSLVQRTVSRAGVAISLLPKEFALLEYFMRNEGRVLSKTMLLERVWNFHFDPRTTVVETHVSRLRGKIDKAFDYALLETIKNVGYRLRVPE